MFELKIKGMSCHHCVNHVKEALEEISGIEIKEVDIGSAVINKSSDVTKEKILNKLDEYGYELEEMVEK